MSRFASIFVACSLVASAPVFAQSSNLFVPGTQVVDSAGGAVGSIASVKGNVVTVRTDSFEANLGKDSFAEVTGKLMIGLTKDQLNAAVQEQQAAAAASLAVGAVVKGSAGHPVGTIETMDAEFVTLKLESGKLVKLPRNGVAASADGARIGLTAQQLEDQISGSN
nr:hypothetical protein [uncultured Sphingomonas sp.]